MLYDIIAVSYNKKHVCNGSIMNSLVINMYLYNIACLAKKYFFDTKNILTYVLCTNITILKDSKIMMY
ncbi:hypothetical protein EHRUM3_07880 [Ehrlichia ruminantium]|uniref:Uncharacterized protein n=1 Tax=Ehrlichia ruminantium TaxID=779 RepID=A0A170T3G8_EHRRU|nr:hypothetical protein EHRUM3_07880 [Ehrlichia ruminantium]